MPDDTAAQHPAAMVTQPRMNLKPIKPHKYNGQRDHSIIETWINAVNAYFILSAATAPYIYYTIVTLLEGEAAVWFRYHYPETLAATLTWEVIRTAIRTYFVPVNHVRQLQGKYASLRQTGTVSEYTTKFSDIAMQLSENGMVMPNLMLIGDYIRGLKPQTRLQVEIENPQTLNDAARIATTYDTLRFGKFTSFNGRYETTSRSPFASASTTSYDVGEPMQLDSLSFKTKASLNKLSIDERAHLRKLGACFKCRQPGHLARNCPTGHATQTFASSCSKNVNTPKNVIRQ
jgi:hypothetical protein